MSKKYESRISGLIQSHLTTLIETQLNDPRVTSVTVTEVAVSSDTRHAKVYYSVLGSADDKDKAARGLDSAAGWLSRELGRRLRTKHTPQIRFVYDESLERGEYMAHLLDEVKAREDELKARERHNASNAADPDPITTAERAPPAQENPKEQTTE
jgi:ribosome-binding factor A